MPRFPYDTATCEAQPEECSKRAIVKFIYDNLDYSKVKLPEEASERQTAIVTFSIEKTGEVKDIRLARDLPYIEGAGEEALRIVRLMRDQMGPWTPGSQAGKLVKVRYNMPIKFERPVAMESTDHIFVDEFPMPIFPFDSTECQESNTECSQRAILEYVYSNLSPEKVDLPADSSQWTILVVSFKIDTFGQVQNIWLVRDAPLIPGAGAEALRVIRKMRDEVPPWKPARYLNGRAVESQFNLPIRIDRAFRRE